MGGRTLARPRRSLSTCRPKCTTTRNLTHSTSLGTPRQPSGRFRIDGNVTTFRSLSHHLPTRGPPVHHRSVLLAGFRDSGRDRRALSTSQDGRRGIQRADEHCNNDPPTFGLGAKAKGGLALRPRLYV